jgi:hypothetical protein
MPMLTEPEMAAVGEALDAARAEVERLEGLAAASAGPLSFFWDAVAPSDSRRAASAARSTYRVLLDVRNALVESAEADHEAVLQLVANARELAQRGMVAHAIERPSLLPSLPSPGDLAGALRTALYVGLGLVALLAVAVIVRGAAALFGRR